MSIRSWATRWCATSIWASRNERRNPDEWESGERQPGQRPGRARGDAILSVQGLRAGYGDIPVLRGVSMDLTENEVLGLLGHNGMGKSTLLKTLMGLLPATGGQIAFEGTPITRLPTWRRSRLGFGYVPQGRGIFPSLTVRENLHFAWSEETGDASAEAGIDRIVADFPRLAPLLDRQGGVLSGGEQQILAVARCLIADPVLFLLDEPTEGIQPSIIEEMAETLVSIRASRGLTLLLVEQNLEFLTQLSDRILVLERGAVKAEIARDQFGATGLIEEFAGLGGGSAGPLLPRLPPPAAIPAGAATAPLARPQPQVHPRTPAPKPPPRRPEAPPPPPAQPIGNAMTVRRPTLDQMREIVRSFGMSMSDGEIQSFLDLMEPTLAAYDRVDALRDAPPAVKYPRTPGTRPGDSENPMNAWYIKCEIRGAPGGRLDGKTVALKDNVCLAGVPMMNGASTLEGYTPDLDATIVTRMLDEGATSPARPIANISACPAAATPTPLRRCTIPGRSATRPAAPPPAPARWSAPARSTWRSAATRAARSGFRRRSAAATA